MTEPVKGNSWCGNQNAMIEGLGKPRTSNGNGTKIWPFFHSFWDEKSAKYGTGAHAFRDILLFSPYSHTSFGNILHKGIYTLSNFTG
jgi:hypothetical protein